MFILQEIQGVRRNYSAVQALHLLHNTPKPRTNTEETSPCAMANLDAMETICLEGYYSDHLKGYSNRRAWFYMHIL